MIGNKIEGIETYPISLRYPQDYCNNLDSLRRLPISTAKGQYIMLANVEIKFGRICQKSKMQGLPVGST